jgi:L-fuconolactonase
MLIDAHFHLWDPDSQPHGWLGALPSLNRRFAVPDFEAVALPAGVRAGVLVQALASASETRELLAVAAEHDVIAGVVGWVDVQRPDVAEQIEQLRALPGGEYLVGIRHLVQDEADPRWLLREAVGRGIEALGRAGLVYDLLIKPAQLDAALGLVAGHPDVRFVLDHGAKPAIADGAFEPWANELGRLALLPNLACKLSGLVTEAGAGWTAAQIEPYITHLLNCFGPQRLLFGSDWPVCTLAASFADVAQLARAALAARLSDGELDAVLYANAVAQYRLGVRAQTQ